MGVKSCLNQIKLWFHSKKVKPKLDNMFEKTEEGYIVYKVFGLWGDPPEYCDIKENCIIEENVDMDEENECSYGINVVTIDLLRSTIENEYGFWKCLLSFGDLDKVCVPYGTDGKIRCGRLKLLKKYKTEDIIGYQGECYD